MHSLQSANTVSKGVRRNAAADPSSPPISPRRILHHTGRGLHDLLEPAIDGPPSPERLRALSRQVKHNAIADKHSSQLTTSSGSSWEHSIDDPPISRRSSQRSISGSIPLHDRPDSIMVFGKSIFSRKPKLRRDISDPNLSSNALHPPRALTDSMPPSREQRSMAALFARRKSVKGDETQAPAQKKMQISGPYNFQHLTHTQKDSLPNLEQTSRMELVSEFSCIRAGQRPTNGSLKGIQADDIQFQHLPSELLYIQDFEPELDQAQLQQGEPARDGYTGNSYYRESFLPRIRPSSSLEDTILAPFSPPPRVSSRMSARLDSFEFLPSDPERLAPIPGPPRRQSEPHIHMASRHTESPDPSHAVTTLDDAVWPLSANAMDSLPELPEEEEIHTVAKEPAGNLSTKCISLRGSVSVPALHRLSLSQAKPPPLVISQRTPSNASDTLGEFNIVKIRRGTVNTEEHMADDLDPLCETWEDDIDYCYEHAAEANCDFAWERPSFEMHGGDMWEEGLSIDYRISAINSTGTFSPDMLSPRASDVPFRSPTSHISSQTQSRSGTPSTSAAPVTSNFSLPHRAHNRALSRSDSFRDRARGLSMSPTFFISTDNNQKISEDDEKEEFQDRDDDDDDDDDEDFLTHLPVDGSSLHLDKKAMLLNARSSASTDVSAFSEHSLSSSRHKSNGSINTALTGWTASSTCPSLDGWPANSETSQSNVSVVVNDEEQTVVMSGEDDDIATSAEPNWSPSRHDHGHERHRSDADLLMKACIAGSVNIKEAPKPRRRARTTSRSHNSPQLALFPHIPQNTRRS